MRKRSVAVRSNLFLVKASSVLDCLMNVNLVQPTTVFYDCFLNCGSFVLCVKWKKKSLKTSKEKKTV